MPELGMFEITPMGLVIVVVGMAYMMFIGRRLLPEHKDVSLTANYAMREYMSEIIVLPNSPLIGQKSYDSDLNVLEFRILKIVRAGAKWLSGRRWQLPRATRCS
jgi:di/tricarboxylate transporter